MRLTQYLESQENQDMTRLALLHYNSKEWKKGCFCVLWNVGEGGLCSSVGENMNENAFNES